MERVNLKESQNPLYERILPAIIPVCLATDQSDCDEMSSRLEQSFRVLTSHAVDLDFTLKEVSGVQIWCLVDSKGGKISFADLACLSCLFPQNRLLRRLCVDYGKKIGAQSNISAFLKNIEVLKEVARSQPRPVGVESALAA